jgi:hypothetical protein
LEALVKGETQRRRPNVAQEKSNVDIMSLLTKAGQEYEQVGLHFVHLKKKIGRNSTIFLCLEWKAVSSSVHGQQC